MNARVTKWEEENKFLRHCGGRVSWKPNTMAVWLERMGRLEALKIGNWEDGGVTYPIPRPELYCLNSPPSVLHFFLKLFLLPDLLTQDLQPAQTTQTGLNVTPFHEPAQADHEVTFRMTSNYSCLIPILNFCPKGSTNFICITYMYGRVSLRDMRDLIPTSIDNDKDPLLKYFS